MNRWHWLLIALLALPAAWFISHDPAPANADPPPNLWVTSTGDFGDGVCNSTCTLREAVNAANAAAHTDVIAINIGGAT